MKDKFYEGFKEFLIDFDLNDEQYDEIMSLYDQLDDNDIDDLKSYLTYCDDIEEYDYNDLKEELMDILNQDEDYDDDETNDFHYNSPIKDEEDFDEEIERIDDEEDFDEEIERIDDEEDFDEEIERIDDEEDFDEEIERIDDEVTNDKIVMPTLFKGTFSKIKGLVNRVFKKKKIETETIDYIPKQVNTKEIEELIDDETTRIIEENNEAIIENNDNNIDEIIKTDNIDNKEILDYIKFINCREDKDQLINELATYIDDNGRIIDDNLLLCKLRGMFGVNNINDDTKEEKIQIKEEIKTEEVSEVKKEEKVENKLTDKYEEAKKEIFDELDEYEKSFVEDMIAEGLNPGDSELDQMFNERNVNKTKIYKYLLKLEKIKLLNAYENLGEFEKEFADDAAKENITHKDAEFNQMLNERCVSKKAINNYYSILEDSNNYQKLITDDYMKHINYEASINLEEKNTKELKEIAKENNLSKYSKLNKAQLIEKLNELTNMKIKQAENELSLTK